MRFGDQNMFVGSSMKHHLHPAAPKHRVKRALIRNIEQDRGTTQIRKSVGELDVDAIERAFTLIDQHEQLWLGKRNLAA